MDIHTPEIRNITITPEILKLIAEIDEFKGRWKVMESLAPEKLTSLRRIATIESVGSSTRIEGARLSDKEVEKLLSGVKAKSFSSRDEQEVAGYADAMDMVFESFESITITENPSSSSTVFFSSTAARIRSIAGTTRECRTMSRPLVQMARVWALCLKRPRHSKRPAG
jgi:Fic family protein